MSNLALVDKILVPQGSEYMAVCRGLKRVNAKQPIVQPIPIGIQPVKEYLQQWSKAEDFRQHISPKILVMGLCGSLNQQYKVGDIVLYQECLYQQQVQECNHPLTAKIHSALSENSERRKPPLRSSVTHHWLNAPLYCVRSLTSDRVICSATEKRYLGETMGVDVVDMEGFAALEFFNQIGVEVAMLRVVSDDCHHDIPDISAAINPDGSLQPLSLALRFMLQPIAATRLIRGSLQGLKVLEQVTQSLFSDGNVAL
nr:phosphorylase [Nostoc sp. PCC 7524]